jgi:hypothetical protein
LDVVSVPAHAATHVLAQPERTAFGVVGDVVLEFGLSAAPLPVGQCSGALATIIGTKHQPGVLARDDRTEKRDSRRLGLSRHSKGLDPAGGDGGVEAVTEPGATAFMIA